MRPFVRLTRPSPRKSEKQCAHPAFYFAGEIRLQGHARTTVCERRMARPPKPKARLCVAGHRDPDLGRKDMAVDAPTAGRHSLLLAIQLALARSWVASIGDIRAAFLNGVQAPRQLYLEQPRRGIPCLEPGYLGVFGLSTSPKLWWMKLSGELNGLNVEYGNDRLFVRQNEVDPASSCCSGRKARKSTG